MRVDLQTLGEFNDLADAGATKAAASLSELTDVPTTVDVTRADLVPVDDIPTQYRTPPEFVGVDVAYGGGMEGRVLLVFDGESADRLLESVVPDHWDAPDESLSESGITESANIMVGGFLDAWADHYGTAIQPEPPTYVSGRGSDIVPDDVPTWGTQETALSFTSQLVTPGTDGEESAVQFNLYMFPDQDSFEAIVDEATVEEDVALSIEELGAFNHMTREGAGRAADKVSSMTGFEVDVDVGRTTFVPAGEVQRHASDGQRVGAVSQLKAAPGGFVAILFDRDSARTVGDAMLPMEVEEGGVTDMHRNAIEEIGNIMISGFIDGWANALDRRIQHEPPTLVEDRANATLGGLVDDLEGDQEYAFVLDATVSAGGAAVSCDLFAIPEMEAFGEVVQDVAGDTMEAIATDDAAHFEPADYEDLE